LQRVEDIIRADRRVTIDIWRLLWKINSVFVSLYPFGSFQSRSVTYLLIIFHTRNVLEISRQIFRCKELYCDKYVADVTHQTSAQSPHTHWSICPTVASKFESCHRRNLCQVSVPRR
jgi:hypothetical protein